MRSINIWRFLVLLLLICVLVLSSVLFMAHSNNKETNMDRVIALIGDKRITYRQFQDLLEKKYGSDLINQLVDHEVVAQEGQALSITVSDSDVEEEVKTQQQGYDDEAQFYKSMKEQLGLTKEQIYEDAHYKLLLERIATINIRISETQVDDYIKTHPDEFNGTTKYHLQQILLKTQDQADKVYNQLQNGSDFGTVAQSQSIDEATAGTGGDLGWVEPGDPFIPGELLDQAKRMRPEEISLPIALKDSFAIIKLVERQDPSAQDVAVMKERVRRELALNEAPPVKDVVKNLRLKRKAVILEPALQ